MAEDTVRQGVGDKDEQTNRAVTPADQQATDVVNSAEPHPNQKMAPTAPTSDVKEGDDYSDNSEDDPNVQAAPPSNEAPPPPANVANHATEDPADSLAGSSFGQERQTQQLQPQKPPQPQRQ